jgi:Tol biopolymer transport system component
MALQSGSRLGHYTISARLGAGGMGEVYRGRDTRLNRDVAIKIIPEELAGDPDRLARFTREAQTLAALSHPHIAHVYGLEESGSAHAIVMELIEGEDLARRIGRGRVPVREAIRIALQIAEALEVAHEKGVVHRDLKPSNVMLDRDGQAKVLDFGLASAPEPEPGNDISSAPTLTSPAKLTGRGVVLGTPAYMSPEQMTGHSADKRSDMWSFGCVLYELLTGQRPFDGGDTHEAMMAIASREPDWSLLGADVPPQVRTLLKRCLEKSRKRRLSDMSAARFDLEDASRPNAVAAQPMHAPRSTTIAAGPAITLVLVVVAAAAGWFASRAFGAPEPLRPLIRIGADIGAPVSLNTTQGASAVLSPDGRRLVFVAQSRTDSGAPRLYSRRLDALNATPITGTEGAMNPFFSPDGEWLGFFANTKLRKIPVAGGTAIDLADALNGRGGTWSDDNQIIYMPDFYSGLWKVAAAGGPATQLTTPPSGTRTTHRWPQALPGSKAVIYTTNRTLIGYENGDVVIQPLPSGEARVLQKNAYFGQYLASGHLTFVHKGALHAVPFDLASLQTTGEALPILDDVSTGSLWTGAAQFSASNEGTAVYVPGSNFNSAVTTVDQAGTRGSMLEQIHNWANPQYSPDGRRFAFDVFDGVQADVWVYDLVSQSLNRLTHSPRIEVKPIWSADGKRIAFFSVEEDGSYRSAWQLADGSGDAKTLLAATSIPTSFHPSGRYLAYVELSNTTSFDAKVMQLDLDRSGNPKPGRTIEIATTPAAELEPVFSPDGRWIAYASAHTGRFEVYVRPFPELGGTWQVSTTGGSFPTWSKDGKDLLFATLDQRVMAASYSVEGNSFKFSAPRIWTNERHRLTGPTFMRNYDLHPDGSRLAYSKVADPGEKSSDPVVVVFNFFDELRRTNQVR